MDIGIDVKRFLRACFRSEDWAALLLRNRPAGRPTQRIFPVASLCSSQVQQWLRGANMRHTCVYVSVNTLVFGARSRTRLDFAAVRHVFLDVDRQAHRIVRGIEGRSDLPSPSYLVHTSPDRVHILWRVGGFDVVAVERLQKGLAGHLGADPAATSVTQMTRLPGFWNYKYPRPYLVWVEYRDVERVYTQDDFPFVDAPKAAQTETALARSVMRGGRGRLERAVAYLSRVPPAVAGNHGDLHTFQTCCRAVRGFALDDDQAFAVLAEWNARCDPPWTERELREKIRSARRNGREPIGGLL